MHATRWRPAVLSAALAAAVLSPLPSAAADEPRAASAAGDGLTGGRSVTLLTGDRVAVDDEGRVLGFRPGKGRSGVPVAVRQSGDRTYVIPADAAHLIRAGTLDRRLFDVRELHRSGYGDTDRADLPLIVTYERSAARLRGLMRDSGARVTRQLPSIGGDAVSAAKSSLGKVWSALTETNSAGTLVAEPGTRKIWLDARYRTVLDESVPQIGAPAAWEAGYDGTGTTIAVLDTGVDETHPDLDGRETAQRNFSSAEDAVDRFGHGTHVASIAAGSGEQSGGRYRGAAPGARILDGKVLDDTGFGQASWIIAGMEWAVGQGADVVNMSLGGPDTEETDPLEAAVDSLSEDSDTVFVIAAGNSGPGRTTVNSPGSARAALTVGAVDKSDRLADFSSRGPAAGGAIKPDLTAPGVNITAAAAENGVIGDPVTEGYVELSGTSMATPHVAAAAAMLAQQHPDWSGERIKDALTSSVTSPLRVSPYQQGTGRVDVAQVVEQTLTHVNAPLNFGVHRWPHGTGEPDTRRLTYRNTGDEPVTLALSTRVYGPGGAPSPAETFATAQESVTVPAGGTASVDVTADTGVGEAYGHYSGIVTAEGGGQTVRSALGVYREPESYDLTLRHTGRDGNPTADYTTALRGLDDFSHRMPYDSDGTVTLRLERGVFALDSTVLTTEGGEITGTDWLNQPLLTLDQDTTVDIDARRARPVDVTVPDPRAEQEQGSVGYQGLYGAQVYQASQILDSFAGFRTAHLGPELPEQRLTAQLSGTWRSPGRGGVPDHYRLAFRRTGSLYTGFTHHTAPAELARVDVGLGASVPGKTGQLRATPELRVVFAPSIDLEQPLPGRATEHLLAEGVRWQLAFRQTDTGGGFGAAYETPFRSYTAGERYRERFNTGVFGPSLGSEESGIRRSGNSLSADVPLFADGAGHRGFWTVSNPLSALYRDGEKIWEERVRLRGQRIRVPAEAGAYRLTTDVYRPATVTDVSTRVRMEWTFTSERPEGAETVPLPASVVRYSPALDLTSSARAGAWTKVPFSVQGSASGTAVERIVFDVSYDGGETWERVRRTADDHFWVRNRAGAEAVSLRAGLTDAGGNTVTQTVYRAYTLD
ncbi:S8 family peptidase [Streptomyces sp. TRM68416]|uniref:S8 family peptidase n=1 Tax=Streptomyces sp. TRM68416 TaxID=2758412 RepID=UPI0016618E33|nr:S8 family serine peptidase [Streptomyces sp. TRM68416]MBD0844152.1 S8 family serine peptidase [Streptomyces sp. TRM68416]